MSLSFDAAEALIYEFCQTYPQARTIMFNLAQTQEELYGPQNTVALRGRISGSYRPASGRADFALASCGSDEEFRRTLRHEILGHFGINTSKPEEKRAILERLIEARDEPEIAQIWAEVDRAYVGMSELRKAEEVFAFACETIEPHLRINASAGMTSFDDTCLSRRRPLTLADLDNITTMVAEGLHDRSRSQQTFPASDSAQFKQDNPMNTSEYPVWLAVQPDDRDKMRAAAGLLSDGRAAVEWNKEEKLWLARPGCDLDRIRQWLPDRSVRAGGGDPEAEFLDVLTQAGLVIKGMPVMNGKRQRVPTIDDKGGKKSGVYTGYLNRRPAGWFINYHRSDSAKDVTNWTSTGGDPDPAARLHIRAAARQSQDDVTRERAAVQAAAALAAKRLYDRLPAADPSHPYLVRKGIPPTPALRETRNGALVVPFFSAQGNFKTLQYIPAAGDKYLFEDAPKKGNFLVVGGALEPGQPILYAEGYATARSLNLATGRPVVMTIDAGNMVAVAQILHQQYPASQHVFLADFDHAKAENKGLIMATEAAAQVGGQVLYPAFTPDEIAQGFTDFNDLHQSRGLDAVRDQTAPLFTQQAEEPTMPEQPVSEPLSNPDATPSLQPPADLFELAEPAPSVNNEPLAQAAQVAAQLDDPAPVVIAGGQPAVVEPTASINDEIKPDSVTAEVAPDATEPVVVTASPDQVAQAMDTPAEAPLAVDTPAPVQSSPAAVATAVVPQPPVPAPEVVISPAVRQALEREWTSLQREFLTQQVDLSLQLRKDLLQALTSEKAILKAQVLVEAKGKPFGERLAASVGFLGLGAKQTQIFHLNQAIAQVRKGQSKYDLTDLNVQRVILRQTGETAIAQGRPNRSALGELSKSRETWVNEQAAVRLTREGLAPLATLNVNEHVASWRLLAQEQVKGIVRMAKDFPEATVRLAREAVFQYVDDHAFVESQRFKDVELVAAGAIDARAEAFADAMTPSPGAGQAPAPVLAEDARQWARLDVQDLSVIEADALREVATDTVVNNAQAVPVYAQQVEAAGIQVSPDVVAVPAPEFVPKPAATPPVEQAVASDAPAVGPAAAETIEVPAAATAAESSVASEPVVAPGVETPVTGEPVAAPVSAQPEAAPVVEPVMLASATDNPAPAVPAQDRPQIVAAEPVAPQTAQAPVVQANEQSADVNDVADQPDEVQEPVTAPAAAAESEPPVALATEDLVSLMPRRSAAEEPSAEAAMDGINVGPRIGQDQPPLQPIDIDKDALLSRITPEPQSDNSVLYKLDNEPAFVDRGSRLEMAPGAGQSDEKIMAALLTAARFYRGQIELTGSDAFKTKAIDLIAQHRVNVSMKNPAQQLMLDQARQALGVPAVKPDAILGNTPPPFDPAPPVVQAAAPMQVDVPRTAVDPVQPASTVATRDLPSGMSHLLEVPDVAPQSFDAAQYGPVDDAPPLGVSRQIQPEKPAAPEQGQVQEAKVSPAVHQPSKAAEQGVTGKVISCGNAPFRFDEKQSESWHIKLRTKEGIQTFWGKELAGLLRESRIEPGRMVTLQFLGQQPVTVKAPVKDPATGAVLGYEDKPTHRNQWSMALLNGPTVRTGDDQGVKLTAYDAARFEMIQHSVIAQLGVEINLPPRPADGLFWMTPNGQGSAKAGDELSAARPAVDTADVGKPVASSWSADGHLDMALFRGDGPYLQGVVRQGDSYQHVLVSLPGSAGAPPMVFNAITEQGLVPIGVGNGINRSGGEPVAREHIAFKLEGDKATRIAKLDFPAELQPALHARLGFDERWKDTNTLPKSSPAAAPKAQPSALRPN